MARTNIFQVLSEKAGIANDIDRLDTLFNAQPLIHFLKSNYTLMDFVDNFCFANWKSRGHCLNVEDFLDEVEYDTLMHSADENVESFITFSEIILNFHNLAAKKIAESKGMKYHANFNLLYDIIIEDLSKINHKIKYDEKSEQIIVIEDKAEVTAVAESVDPELSFEVVRYNHYSLAGNLDAKKTILLHLGAELEPKRKILNSINASLTDYIFFMLNKMNLRHNNCDIENASNFYKYVYEMEDSDLEAWYDELYQMILLAFLELNQLERNGRLKILKGKILGDN